MTLHWTFVLYTLYVEVAFACLLMIPGLSTVTARLVQFIQKMVVGRNQTVHTGMWFVWLFYVGLFLEALRQVWALCKLNFVLARALGR